MSQLNKIITDSQIKDVLTVFEHVTITNQELGKGSYGTVYAAVLDGKPCVAKVIHPH